MEYIHKLPFIIGSFMAIVVGMINYKLGVEQKDTYTRMAIGLVAFFAVGLIIRNLVTILLEEQEKKKKEQQELQMQQQLEEKKNKEAMAEAEYKMKSAKNQQHSVDYTVSGSEEFEPLKVSEYLSSKNEV